LEQVVFKGLSKEATHRYVDVLSFAAAFEEASYVVTSPYMLPVTLATFPSQASSYQHSPHMPFRNIPVPLTPLIGRAWELQATRDILMRPDVRLVSLTGTRGIGKTHLALSLGTEVTEEFADGVCFVSLAAINDPELVIPAIAVALGLQVRENNCSLERLKTLLRDKQLLVLLDNFEQVLSAAPLLSDLLSFCPWLKLLVTSRALLQIEGEFTFTIPPLEMPGLQNLPDHEVLSHIASVALFVHRMQATLPAFQLTGENAYDIAAICNRLEGVPLSLELAAARCKLLSPRSLLSQLEHSITVLSKGRQDAPLRHQTLHNTLSWNDNLLSPDEQVLFRRLAVFVGGYTLQAAEAISAALGGRNISVQDGVISLIDKSLLLQPAHDNGEPRLYFLEMIREYGLERLGACGELEQARAAHAAYYLALVEEAASMLPASSQTPWQKRLEDEHENLHAALEWLLEQFWLLGDDTCEGRAFLERALDACSESNAPVSTQVMAKALEVADHLALKQIDQLPAIKCYEDSRQSGQKLQVKQDIMATLNYKDSLTPDHDDRVTRPEARISHPIYESLTKREIEVLGLVALGLKNSQIAERLFLSPHTVSAHIQSIFGKLGLNSRSAATRYAIEHHLA
jgi:predicted ATPase/DNA-binding CsgD family transcriptional regulator